MIRIIDLHDVDFASVCVIRFSFLFSVLIFSWFARFFRCPYCLLVLFCLKALLLSSRIDYEKRKSNLSLKLTRRHKRVHHIIHLVGRTFFSGKHLLCSRNPVAQCTYTKTEVRSFHHFYLYRSVSLSYFFSFICCLLEIIFNSFLFLFKANLLYCNWKVGYYVMMT